MSDVNIISLADKLQNLELCLKSQLSIAVGYGRALRKAILCMDVFMEVEVLKGLGDLHLQKGKWSKDSTEFDKAAALYTAALLRCTDPDMGQTLEHRIGYMEKLSKKLLQGYIPHFRCLSQDYWGTADNNILRVAEACDKLDRSNAKSHRSVEEIYTETLVTAIEISDTFLELEVLKSLGDFYLEKGRKTSDLSQFSKATAMYKKALTRCEDPETKTTLHHRIRYAEKIREAVRRQQTLRWREKGSPMGNQIGNITRPDITQGHPIQPDIPSQYKDHQKKGDSSLAMGDLDSAEEHFAAALRTVHIRDSTAQQYQREVEPLCKLGDVYSKRGQQTGDGGDFVKAAALYNAAIARSEDQFLKGNITTTIEEIEKSFMKCIFNIHYDRGLDETEKHKKQLNEMRDQIKLEMETIDQQLDPYVHDEDDPCVKEIEAKRAQAVRKLFETIAQQRKEFITLLVEECIGIMGPPPCKYALIGLGSQAAGLVTPYSDLEFAILVEEESEECLVYFRNLTRYLHLKVVNLGETILPALGIKSLNDFYSEDPLANWYYDSVTPRGFAFDGSMPNASKTPLGRQGNVNDQSSELICTPNNMASILLKDVTLYLKEGYHLATILRNPCLITGDQDVIDTYKDISEKMLQADEGKITQQLAKETQIENIEKYKYSNKEAIIARMTDVKKHLYRFPSLAVDCLALSSHIEPTTVWETIEQMKNKKTISPNNAHHLTVLTSISAELRLRTYIANSGQKENFSALASMETLLSQEESSPLTDEEVQQKAPKTVFHLPNEKQLFRYYYTALPLEAALSNWSGENADIQSFPDFYDNSPRIRGLMYLGLCKHRLAISYLHEALNTAEGSDTTKIMSDIGEASNEIGDYHQAVRYYEQVLTIHKKTHGQSIAHPNIAKALNSLGVAWTHLGEHRKAISYLEEALEMRKRLYGQSTAHPDIASSLNNLGIVWQSEGDYRKAIRYQEQALEIWKITYGQTTVHPDIAKLLNNMGAAWYNVGDYRKAIRYYELALQVGRKFYGETSAHPHIATLLNSLGGAWRDLSEYRKAVSYFEHTLHMQRNIFGQQTAHPDIAKVLNNLGVVWSHLGERRKAISYQEKALQMYRRIYGPHTVHPGVAQSLNNIGTALYYLGDYRKAISYHEQALEMKRSIYGQTKAHPDIANILNNLGGAWCHLGKRRRAVNYYEQALQIYRSIHGPQTVHPDIAESLSNLGTVYSQICDYMKAIAFFEQALNMFRIIYGQSTAHPKIAAVLNNIGGVWSELGDYKKTLSYYEQALQMKENIYGQGTAHVDIALSLNNIGSVLSKYLGESKKAISYFDRALQIIRGVYGQSTTHPDIATLLSNLGAAWAELGEHRRAVSYHEQALEMRRSIYGPHTPHADIAESLNNLGTAWNKKGDSRKAIIYHEQALEMYKSFHGRTNAHPDIANSLTNLGRALNDLGEHSRAVSCHEQALEMRRSIYGQQTAHPHIASSLSTLGIAWYHLGDYRKAISYHEQALQMNRNIYGQGTAHHQIASSLDHLGVAWGHLGQHWKAVSYHEPALQMYRSVYGQSTAHPDITSSLNNLGLAWLCLGDVRKAISYHEQALEMSRTVFGQTKAHPLVAALLNSLAEDWCQLGDHKREVSYQEQALQMLRNIYGQRTPHPQIATLLNNLGVTWSKLGEHRKAISFHEQALQMRRSIYGPQTAHPDIVTSLNNFVDHWGRDRVETKMSDINMTSLTERLQDLELCLKCQHSQKVGYGRALREAILRMDLVMEIEVLKSLGDLHLKKGKRGKDSAEFDKAAALYAAAQLRCTDPDMGQTLEHRIGYMEKLSRQLLQGYTPHFRWLSPDYWGTADGNVLRVAEICDQLDRGNTEFQHSVDETYTETLVTSIGNGDMFLELEILKSLGDFYLGKGKETFDLSQFSKAAAMYGKALRRCEDPGTKQTLHHRVLYMVRIWGAVRRSTWNISRQTERRSPMKHQFGNITRAEVTEDHPIHQGTASQYQDHLKKGEASLARADLDSAEEHFAAALKSVHMPDPTAQQYQREVEPLCMLGVVYSKRGQQTGDGGDFVKAAALYNAAIARSEDHVLRGKIATDIEEVNKSFLKFIFDIDYTVSPENTQNHKKQLKEMRDQIKLEMETIDQQLDPYVHDEDDPCVKEIEAKRAQAVRKLFENIAQQRKEFISLLVEECIGLMGHSPCKYALIGLGSQATGLVTPYSDLEFAILVEEESQESLLYFRNLTHYLHLKVVNLGETILPALGIKSLNDFYSEYPLNNWYYDSVTPRGFAFDGSMPKASKTPLGRQETLIEQSSELICTPNNMVSVLLRDVTLYLKEGYHLATILRNPCLIAGDQNLIDIYMSITEKILQADGGKISQQLAHETLRENLKNYRAEETITARLIDVKKELYRFPAVAVDCLALSAGIIPTTVWETIEDMKKKVISPNNAHHLTVLTSISAELRLRTYIANGGQRENFSALTSMETILNEDEPSLQVNEEVKISALKPVFHLPNEKQLLRYYKTSVPLKSALSRWSGKNQDLQPFSDFYDNSPRVRGLMYHELCKYRLAIGYYQEALNSTDGTDTDDTIQLLNYIGNASFTIGDHYDAIGYYEHALRMCRSIYGQTTAHPLIATFLNNLGATCNRLGDQRRAVNYHEQSLELYRSIYGQQTANADIAGLLNNLAEAWHNLGEHKTAVSYNEQALQMKRSIYGPKTAHPDIVISLCNLGQAWQYLGDHRKAISYYEQALKMFRSVYGQTTAHPQIAVLLNNLGSAWRNLGKHRRAVSYHELALQMRRNIYGPQTAHPHIAQSLNNLGIAWGSLGEHRKVLSYHEQALQMYIDIYGAQKAHPLVATSLNNLGKAWEDLGEYRRAISYYEQALQMYRGIYGQQTAHPNIAISLYNLGTAWYHLGDCRKAIGYNEQAFRLFRSVYGQTTAHPQIASLLNNLGESWNRLGEHRKAVSYHEQALQMHRSNYDQQTARPVIANSLKNLGGTWCELGDYRKAISYYEQALQENVRIYGETTAHPHIAQSLNSLGKAWYDG
uniref:Protein-PII uridylyltransferase N-terminal domain-containing protein n=1 Tax=Branchiostoma floridae TaxID=7739 RepID=C3Y008_BRAFL|eukprot:XP_002610364.1 hypothetical protein BRAFLDRAFT_72434 [Branchiostoma floridae]